MPRPNIDEDSFDKINFVIDSWTTGCEAPWYVYIETMKPAALEAFIVLISFGWADVVRGAFRPKGLGRRTGKKKGKWGKYKPGFPEVGNTLGKSLPFAEQLDDYIKWSNGFKTLWRIDNLMQAAFFMWLVADVAEDFAYNWTSPLYDSYWCQEGPPTGFSFHNTTEPTKSAYVWHKHAYANKDWLRPFPFWGFDGGRTGPDPCSIGAAVSFSPFMGAPPPTVCRVKVHNPSTGQIYDESESRTPDADGTFRIPVHFKSQDDQGFEVRTYHEPDWAKVGMGAIIGTADKAT